MKITSISESGNNNTLRWALSKGANPITDPELTYMLDEELRYLVTFSDINFFELFRLTQNFRDELKIKNVYDVDDLPLDALMEMFPEDIQVGDKTTPVGIIAKEITTEFINLARQMSADTDIIGPEARGLFTPMISRRYDVQVPIKFDDFVAIVGNDDEQIFGPEYPDTLSKIIEKGYQNAAYREITEAFVRFTATLMYGKKYQKYLNALRYAPLKGDKSKKLYHYGLVGFYKNEKTNNRQYSYRLMPPSSDENYKASIKEIARCKSPLIIDFAIQTPILYMQAFCNLFSDTELPVKHPSSMNDIVDIGIIFEDFITPVVEEIEDEAEAELIMSEFENQVTAYRIRIGEVATKLMRTMEELITKTKNIGAPNIFALMPVVYGTRAIISLDMSKKDEFLARCEGHDVVYAMMKELFEMGRKIEIDIEDNR